ncbi:Zn-dependent hydrolase [Sporolactobacillus shoreicorticis]|uniref:Zn-dependent hydrolase n=1 Tax=Sporolactobacillus shoreicorticis TaxID=1923877 RepID=A0ABW5S465_9BACL|nr:Zn-dependent hydrolase [Sporolactobacillus shoreicorticis]MCO7127131.1 Zn-dependent hydrolase [Sporolactobacillus shoreicorticis]
MVEERRFKQTMNEIGRIGGTDRGMKRLAYSREERQATDYFITQCKAAGLSVRIDAAGNVIARRPGTCPELPAVGIGSHLDTVYEGGKYDGTIGVLAALEIVRDLNDRHIRTKHSIDLFAFACEESARFGFSQIGSKAMAGLIKQKDIASLTDKEGQNIQSVFADRGLEFSRLEEARLPKHALAAFMEMHIEQGPILEAKNTPIGVVRGIAAPTRFNICVKGHAAHSGSTPMNQRQDALIGAAEITIELEKEARREMEHGTVATVGDIEIVPGAMNVVPGETHLKVDIRGISRASKDRVVEFLYTFLDHLRATRHLEIGCTLLSDEIPVRMNADIIASIEKVCRWKKIKFIRMPSGAGHDTMNMAALCPVGMIFVPSIGGISHHPDEHTDLHDIMTGIEVLEAAVLERAVVESETKAGAQNTQ